MWDVSYFQFSKINPFFKVLFVKVESSIEKLVGMSLLGVDLLNDRF